MVASLLAVGASPAAAINDKSKANSASPTSACVGPATADAGFEDTVGLGAEAAINCLAYYGITTGKTASTFDPGSNVTREQMALFLYRAANVAGVDLMGGTMAASFGDIGEIGADRQAAITALARNGILMGRSGMSFMPTAEITRAEMAMALVNLLTMVPGSGVAKEKKNGTYTGLYALTPAVTGTDLDVFADAFASVSAPVNSAISTAYEMGITTGYGDNTFRPNNPVPRKNMASFITRALAHTNARPAGLTAQAVSAGVEVSVRDASFKPLANVAIDAFKMDDSSQAAKAFKADGSCSAAFGAEVETGTTKCQIDPIDPVTGSQGNLKLSVTPNAKNTTVWVWTGDMGDKVSSTTALYEVEVTPDTTATAVVAEAAVISTDFNENADFRAKYGSTVTFTIQLKADKDLNADGDNTDADEDLAGNAKPDAAGDSYKVTITFPNGAVDVKTIPMDSDGSGMFSLSAADPDPATKGSTAVTWQVEAVPSTAGDNTTNSPNLARPSDLTSRAASQTGTVTFADVAPELFAMTAEPANLYYPAPTADSPNTGNRVHIMTTDQYGDPIGNVAVKISTTASGGSVYPTKVRFTFSDGKVSISWSNSFGTDNARTETFNVTPYTIGTDNAWNTADDVAVTAKEKAVSVNWTKTAATDDDGGNLLSGDVDSNTLVLDSDAGTDAGPAVFMYDANDQFVIGTDPATMAAFEEEVAKRLGSTTIANGSITVSSYKAGDSNDVASFTLT